MSTVGDELMHFGLGLANVKHSSARSESPEFKSLES